MYRLQGMNKNAVSKSDNTILKNIALVLDEIGFTCILGKDDLERTTLLNILSGVCNYTSGSVKFKEEELNTFDRDKLLKLRRSNISHISNKINAINSLSLIQNINLIIDVNNNRRDIDAIKYLEYVGLENFGDKKLRTLSNFYKQKFFIALSLAKDPDVLLLDNTIKGMNINDKYIYMELLNKISKVKLVLLSTSDENIAVKYADRIIELSNGKVVLDIKNDPVTIPIQMQNYHSIDSSVDLNDLLQDSAITQETICGIPRSANMDEYSRIIGLDCVLINRLMLVIIVVLMSIFTSVLWNDYNLLQYDFTSNYIKIAESNDALAFGDLRHCDDDGIYCTPYKFDDNILNVNDLGYLYSGDFYTDTNTTTYFAYSYSLSDEYDYTKLGFDSNPITTYTEVIITSAIAHDLFGLEDNVDNYIGKTFTPNIFDIELTVVGIVETNYTESGYISRIIEENDTTSYSNTYRDRISHLAIYTSTTLRYRIDSYTGRRGYTSSGYYILNDSSLYDNIRIAFENNIAINTYNLNYGFEEFEDVTSEGNLTFSSNDFTKKVIVMSLMSIFLMLLYSNENERNIGKTYIVLDEVGFKHCKKRKIYLYNILAFTIINMIVCIPLSLISVKLQDTTVFKNAVNSGADSNGLHLKFILYIVLFQIISSIIVYLLVCIKPQNSNTYNKN